MTGQLDLLDHIEATADPVDKSVVYKAIREVAGRGAPFSANDVRVLLPSLRSNNVIGPCFVALKKAGVIRRHGREYVPSDEHTTRHDIAVWVIA